MIDKCLLVAMLALFCPKLAELKRLTVDSDAGLTGRFVESVLWGCHAHPRF